MDADPALIDALADDDSDERHQTGGFGGDTVDAGHGGEPYEVPRLFTATVAHDRGYAGARRRRSTSPLASDLAPNIGQHLYC